MRKYQMQKETLKLLTRFTRINLEQEVLCLSQRILVYHHIVLLQG